MLEQPVKTKGSLTNQLLLRKFLLRAKLSLNRLQNVENKHIKILFLIILKRNKSKKQAYKTFLIFQNNPAPYFKIFGYIIGKQATSQCKLKNLGPFF